MEKLRRGLKKGDTFEDGGRIFEILEVNEEGYLSCLKKEPLEEELIEKEPLEEEMSKRRKSKKE